MRRTKSTTRINPPQAELLYNNKDHLSAGRNFRCFATTRITCLLEDLGNSFSFGEQNQEIRIICLLACGLRCVKQNQRQESPVRLQSLSAAFPWANPWTPAASSCVTPETFPSVLQHPSSAAQHSGEDALQRHLAVEAVLLLHFLHKRAPEEVRPQPRMHVTSLKTKRPMWSLHCCAKASKKTQKSTNQQGQLGLCCAEGSNKTHKSTRLQSRGKSSESRLAIRRKQ